MEIID